MWPSMETQCLHCVLVGLTASGARAQLGDPREAGAQPRAGTQGQTELGTEIPWGFIWAGGFYHDLQ